MTHLPKDTVTAQNHKASKHEVLIIAVVIAGAFLAILNQTVFAPALPKLMETFQVNAGTAQWVTSIYMLVKRQRVLEEPLLQINALKSRDFACSAIIVTLINCAAAVTNVTPPIFLQNALGASAAMTGLVMMPAAAVGIIISPLSGIVFDRFGPRGITVGGLVVMTLALAGFTLLTLDSTLVAAATLVTLMATGQALANMPANTWGINALANDMIAHGNAISNTGRQVGGAISTALIVTVMTMVSSANAQAGPVASTACGIQAAYGTCAIVSAATLAFAVVKVRSNKKEV